MQTPTNNFILKLSLNRIIDVLREHLLLASVSNLPTVTEECSAPRSLVVDSRAVVSGSTFLAYVGVAVDGHQYLPSAIRSGAKCLIVERDIDEVSTQTGTCVIKVKDGRAAWAALAAASFDSPQNELRLVAITGTNGKTSTAWFVSQLLDQFGHKNIFIGTLGARIGDIHYPTNHTTPDPPQLYGLMREAVSQGAKFCVMEAASQSLAHHKLDLLRFEAAVFTSFSRDHLDFHKSMDEYFAAKWRLFTDLLSQDALKLINQSLSSNSNCPKVVNGAYWYGTGGGSQPAFEIIIRQRSLSGAEILLTAPDKSEISAQIPLLGDHLVENFCASAIVVSRMLGASLKESLGKRVGGVPGRGELVQIEKVNELPLVVVDYAHTPDGLDKALSSMRQYVGGKISVVFGCGGERDQGKRPEMGAIACELADEVYVTSDNPRREDPEKIISDIANGMQGSKKAIHFHVDRLESIKLAITSANVGDLVLIAGKGHEDYQILGENKIHFDDREVARSILESIRDQ